MSEILGIIILVLILIAVWTYRKSIHLTAQQAEKGVELWARETKVNRIERTANIKIEDEMVAKANANQSAIDSVDL